MTSKEAVSLNGRQVIIKENDFFPKDQLAYIRLISESEKKLFLEFELPVTIFGINYKYVIAAPRLADDNLKTLLYKGVLGCAVIWVPEKKFNNQDPLDLKWWRGGAAAITDIVLK